MKPGDKITSDADWAALPALSVVEEGGQRFTTGATSTALMLPSEMDSQYRLVSLPSFATLEGSLLGVYLDCDGDEWEVREDGLAKCEGRWEAWVDGYREHGPFQFVSPLGGWPSERAASMGVALKKAGLSRHLVDALAELGIMETMSDAEVENVVRLKEEQSTTTPPADAVIQAHIAPLTRVGATGQPRRPALAIDDAATGFYKTATGRGLHLNHAAGLVRLWAQPRHIQPHWGGWIPMSEVPADELPLSEWEHPNACPKCLSTDRVTFWGTTMPRRIEFHRCSACGHQEQVSPRYTESQPGAFKRSYVDLRKAPSGFYACKRASTGGVEFLEWDQPAWLLRCWNGKKWGDHGAWNDAFNNLLGPFKPCADPSAIVDEPTVTKGTITNVDCVICGKKVPADESEHVFGRLNGTDEDGPAHPGCLATAEAAHLYALEKKVEVGKRAVEAEDDRSFEERSLVEVPLTVRVPPGLLEALDRAKRYAEGALHVSWRESDELTKSIAPALRLHIVNPKRHDIVWLSLKREDVGTEREATPENVHAFVRDALRDGR